MYRDQRVPPPTARDLTIWDGLDQGDQEAIELVQRIFCGGKWVKGDGHTINPQPYDFYLPNQSKQS